MTGTNTGTLRQLPGLRHTDHVGLTVPNLEDAIRFFVEVLGAEELYRSERLYRPNSDFIETGYDVRLKQQLTPKDSVYLQASFAYSSGGNTAQYYDQADAVNDPFRFKDKQEPILIAGYHHEWSPGVHSLILGSRLDDRISVGNPVQNTLFVDRVPGGLDYAELMDNLFSLQP